MTDRRILMGVIGRPHGVRGLVHVQSYTSDPSDLARYGVLSDDTGRAWTLAWRSAGVAELRDADGHVVADRSAAERLTNTRLYVERDRLPAPATEEFYLADLVGLISDVGRVTVVHDYGAGVSLEFDTGVIVPFNKACVPKIDVQNGTLTVVIPTEITVTDQPPLTPAGEGKETRMTWHATILTLFPSMFPGPLGDSLAGRALGTAWRMDVKDIRDATTDRHRTVDDTPFGGGAGMVMRADVLDAALGAKDDRPLLYMSPRGLPLSQNRVRQLAQGPGVTLVCGRYEGVDQRVLDARDAEEVSIGDYVLSGGELPALVLLDACIRLLPGVMGASDSAHEESFSHGLLEYPHYTRPAEWQGQRVPDVLLSGHHAAIATWRQAQAEQITQSRRPDLWRAYMQEGTPS